MLRHPTGYVTTLLLLLAVAAARAEDDDASVDEDVTRLQGTWNVVEGSEKGTLTLAGDKFTLRAEREGEVFEGTFKVDSSKSPRQIDMTVTGGSGTEAEEFKGKTSLGIYELEGDALKWCAAAPGKTERPGKFEKGSDILLLTFQRQKEQE